MPDDSNSPNTRVGAMAPDASTSPVGHTPGRWAVARADSPLSALVSANDDGGNRNGGIYVAKAQGPDALANARLIAAAPELLEALEAFARIEVLEPNGVIVGLERYHFERARAAIAKARGTTPTPEVSHVG